MKTLRSQILDALGAEDTNRPLEVKDLFPRFADFTEQQWEQRDRDVAKMRAEDEEKEQELRRAYAREQVIDSGVPVAVYEQLIAGAFESSPIIQALKQRGADVGTYVIGGNPGAGKTFAAVHWLMSKAEGGFLTARDRLLYSVSFVTAYDLGRTTRYPGRDQEDLFQKYSTRKRLVIDDLGAEYADAKGSSLSDLDAVIDKRWRAKLPTLITTNLGPAQFKRRVGARIVDRIRDGGAWLNARAPSLRRARTKSHGSHRPKTR